MAALAKVRAVPCSSAARLMFRSVSTSCVRRREGPNVETPTHTGQVHMECTLSVCVRSVSPLSLSLSHTHIHTHTVTLPSPTPSTHTHAPWYACTLYAEYLLISVVIWEHFPFSSYHTTIYNITAVLRKLLLLNAQVKNWWSLYYCSVLSLLANCHQLSFAWNKWTVNGFGVNINPQKMCLRS